MAARARDEVQIGGDQSVPLRAMGSDLRLDALAGFMVGGIVPCPITNNALAFPVLQDTRVLWRELMAMDTMRLRRADPRYRVL